MESTGRSGVFGPVTYTKFYPNQHLPMFVDFDRSTLFMNTIHEFVLLSACMK